MQKKESENKKEKFICQVSQKVLFYRAEDKKFLLIKCADRGGNFYKHYGPWDIAGGRIDEGEDVKESLEREIREELGGNVQYTLDPLLQPLWHGIFQYNTTKVINVSFLGLYQGGEIQLSDEHDAMRWVTAEEIENDEEIKLWIRKLVKRAKERLKSLEYLNDVKRLQADFENYRKRQQESQKELGGYLIEKLVLDIIPVMNNFQMATEHIPKEEKDSPWVKGVQYIEKQLETVLTDNGVQIIEVKEGEEFDPKIHEAVSKEQGTENSQQEAGEEKEDKPKGHTVAKVVQKGYRIGDKIIRAAKVIVH